MYRYRDNLCSGLREPVLEKYIVIRETKKGKWIAMYPHYDEPPRFVLNDSRKRFAHETKEKALESYIARKGRQIKILTSQLEKAKSYKIGAETLIKQ